MTNFNSGNSLGNIINTIAKAYTTMQSAKAQTSINFAPTPMPNKAPVPQEQSVLNQNLKLNPMDVSENAKYIKELLSLPTDMSQLLSQLAGKNNQNTVQNLQLLLLLQSGKIDLNNLAQYLNNTSKDALQKLVQVMSNALKSGVSDTGQLKELINTLGLISASSTDSSSALKNFILLYLPWLPLNTKGENLDFEISVSSKSGEDGSELEFITILIQTMNYSTIKAVLELNAKNEVDITLNAQEDFPKQKALSVIKKESNDLNIKTSVIIEKAKKLEGDNEAKTQSAQVSSSSQVSPQLVLLANSLIKIIFIIDKEISSIK